MKIYNTLTRTKEEFIPHEEGKVKMYTCGPTVYHYAHIGNLRSYIMEDILQKYLEYSGYDVRRVMNITDVGHLSSDADFGEDKMLSGAKREKKSVMDIARFYTDAFFEDCGKLNIKKPEFVIPATSCIPEFIKMIETLLEKEYAYVSGGNVYFDTSRLDEYYVFNKHDADDLETGVREGVEEDSAKKNKTDFVLWFTKSKFDDQELKWESPWGLGYPGWHIECSAISLKYLGEYLDIHCGGIDNAFPHHTNEIAQSEACIGHKWCSYWFHILHLNTNSGKMSKSTGEFLTVSLLEEKGYAPVVYRFFCLLSHYRKSLVFSYDALDNAALSYEKLLDRIAAIIDDEKGEYDISDLISGEEAEKIAECRGNFCEALDSDLNTSLAITAIYDVLKADLSKEAKLALIADFDKALSLDLIENAKKKKFAAPSSAGDEMISEIEELIKKRAEAKSSKNYALADEIRDKLTSMGVTLKDTKEGTTYQVN